MWTAVVCRAQGRVIRRRAHYGTTSGNPARRGVPNGVLEGAALQRGHQENAEHRVNGTLIMPVEWERIPHGPQAGLWLWTMTAVRPGPRLPVPRSGTEARRGDAGRRVVEAYERLLAYTRHAPDFR
jgi:hypothetical protein